jgi:hypothetical protein
MNNWKDEIARRLSLREERQIQIETILNKVDGELINLIKDLKSEYHIKADVKAKHTSQDEPYWVIRIENASVEVNSSLISKYIQGKKTLSDALIELILDNFKFNE